VDEQHAALADAALAELPDELGIDHGVGPV
jgi:hypothetical protein